MTSDDPEDWGTVDNSTPRRFVIGDLVQLKSGGPTMTVSDAHRLWCRWFDCEHHVQDAMFDYRTLRKVDPSR